MSKRCFRFFGGLMASQANWLNKMAADGYRLVRTGKLAYEFGECAPGKYQYCVEFIGHMSRAHAEDYVRFLEDCGYRVFFKNINLNWSVGKVVARPWAEPGGRIATNATTFNRELLIVEKEADGKPFDLHTTYEDRVKYYKIMRRPWVYMFAIFAVLALAMRTWVWGAFAAAALAGLLVFQAELAKLKKQGSTKEW